MGKDEFSVTAISSNCNGCNLLEILDLFVNTRKGKHICSLTLYKMYAYGISDLYNELWNFIMNGSGR